MFVAPLRPTFDLHFASTCAEINERMQAVLTQPHWNGIARCFDHFAELHIPSERVRYWSPHLSLHLSQEGEGTCVRARFAPRQEVWTFLWILYLLLAFTAFFAAIFAFSVWMLGQTSWMLVVAPLAILGILTLHVVSRVGQNWSSDQMLELQSDCQRLFEEVLRDNHCS